MKDAFVIPSADIVSSCRAVTKPDLYTVLPQGNRVNNALPVLEKTNAQVLASPQLGARFVEYELLIDPQGGTTGPIEDALEHFLFVLEGGVDFELGTETRGLGAGGFVWLPPGKAFGLRNGSDALARVIWFRRKYVAVEGLAAPDPIVSREQDVPAEPEDTYVEQHLIPYDEDLGFDLAFNLLNFEPGIHFSFVESHVMEHGLYMLDGRGVYWLNGDFHEVQANDFIYMAPFCPQFFYATGWEKGRYLLYKDANRDYVEGL